MENPIQSDFIRWIVFLPLLGAIVNGLLGAKIQKSLGKQAISFIACAPVVIAFGLSLYALLVLKGLEPEKRFLIDNLYRWVDLGSLKVDMAFMVDPLSAVMILVVTGIGGLIHFYATAYMHDDPAYWRFFAYLNLFTFAMLTLVLGDSLLLMFVGWEGVGFCSWALIGFWHKELANTTAGNKAFIVNRVGDFGFVLGIFLLFWSLDARDHGTVVFRELAEHAHLLAGATFWGLPVATLAVVASIGAATALVAATIAVAQYDIKRVLAYSTVSQLGYMFLAMGVGAFGAGIFHLYTHAFFKALLFLGSGAVIHALHGEQDIRNMGGLRKYLPITYWTFLIASLAIAGVPLLAGFFSKDEILYEKFHEGHWILWTIGIITSLLTATYMFRLVFLTFFGPRRHDAPVPEHPEEEEPDYAHQHGSDSHHPAPAASHQHAAPAHAAHGSRHGDH